MKQKNVQKDNVNGTGNLVVEKIVESKKGGIFVLAMVLLFWCALLFALPAMAAEKTCAVSITSSSLQLYFIFKVPPVIIIKFFNSLVLYFILCISL